MSPSSRYRDYIPAAVLVLAVVVGVAIAMAVRVPCKVTPPAPYVSAAYAASRTDCQRVGR